jgi:hypothetical protein
MILPVWPEGARTQSPVFSDSFDIRPAPDITSWFGKYRGASDRIKSRRTCAEASRVQEK